MKECKKCQTLNSPRMSKCFACGYTKFTNDAPIYEYQYVCIFHHIIVGAPSFHLTDEEAKALHTEHGKWHKIVETKRERKER